MSLPIIFLESAEKELNDAVIFYNQQKIGLGFEFAFEIQKTLHLIEKYPDAWSPFSANTRK